MDRRTIIAALGLFATVFLIGIPTAAGFWPDQISRLLGWLPLGLILTGGPFVGGLILGTIIGWVSREKVGSDTIGEGKATRAGEDPADLVHTIKGCVGNEKVTWKGSATISEGEIESINTALEATCPKCQSPMNNTMVFWKCPRSDCNHEAIKEEMSRDEAVSLFRAHFERIVESENEDYSLDALLEEINDEPTPKAIWRQYAEVVDDSDVSTSCFH